MKFCSNCGNEVQITQIKGDNIPRHFCISCETVHYINPRIIVGCLAYWEDKVLLCSRSIEPQYGLWNVPGGFLENGESVEAGSVRELWEEANASVETPELLCVYSVPHVNMVYLHFIAKLSNLNFYPGEESLEAKLFRQQEIPWDDIAFNSTRFALEKYFANQQKNVNEVHVGKFVKKV